MGARNDILVDEALDAIERRTQATVPGPWVSYIAGRDYDGGPNFIMTGFGDSRGEDIELFSAEADQDFIAAARTTIPVLLDEIKTLIEFIGENKRIKLDDIQDNFLSDEDLNRITQCVNMASPGPWKLDKKNCKLGRCVISTGISEHKRQPIIIFSGARKEDLEFILHTQADTIFLLKEIKRLRAIWIG